MQEGVKRAGAEAGVEPDTLCGPSGPRDKVRGATNRPHCGSRAGKGPVREPTRVPKSAGSTLCLLSASPPICESPEG